MSETKNHIELGHDLKLFFFDQVSPGSCFFLPHGEVVYQKLIDRIKSYYKDNGYHEVRTPNIYDKKLWITSGHWDKYKENMFHICQTEEDKTNPDAMEFSLKPMNCPGHCLMFKKMNVSHRQLPLRLAEFAVLHRNEASGALRGLTRVRRFQQDDSHIFCKLEHVEAEISNLLKFINDLYVDLGFTYKIEVSTRPTNYIGQLENWDRAESILKSVVLSITGKDPIINEGDGAFYGPKIDISSDSLGRWNQCGTIQLDFNLPSPERFGLTFLDVDQTLQQPIMIHRAILGSIERFMAIVLEHTQGNLPFWMSPRQIMVLPIKPEHHDYAKKVAKCLSEYEVEVNCSNDDLRQKIKEAEIMKFNYILVIGDREVKDGTVAVRERDDKDKKSKAVPFSDLATFF